MTPTPEPLDPDRQPPRDRYCDLVLTGGLTDGVVYPWAVLELARAYRFKNIGGTSVGAMAAALTAAAEYARRRGHLSGFNEVLLKLPGRLADTKGGKTGLYSLFQPAPLTRRLFDLFVTYFSSGTLGATTASYSKHFAKDDPQWFPGARRFFRKVGRLVVHALTLYRVYWLAALLGAAIGLLSLVIVLSCIGLGGPAAWLMLPAARLVVLIVFLVLPALLLFSFALIAFAVYSDLIHGLVPNGFGLCNGGHGEGFPAQQDSLVEWLHEGIQLAARRPLERPLTFKDLWEAPGGPAERPRPPGQPPRKPRSIDLRMVTTNLTHGRPYALPLGGLNLNTGEYDRTSRLFFRLKELDPYFPPQVMRHLEKVSRPYQAVEPEDPEPEQIENAAEFRELPQGELPVVVAARLSLSFPVLFSTVPLWAIDYEADRETRTLQRCSFSDGGICSNFPIHLFDAAIPGWPTFGIWLAPKNIWNTKKIWLPTLHFDGRGDGWNRFVDETSVNYQKPIPALDRLIGFLAAIAYGAKDWNDRATLRMPGVRDRVVRVFLDDDGQGLNLKLTGEHILDLAGKYGQPAGEALVAAFAGTPSRKWDEHRWVRFNTFLGGLRERVEALREAAEYAGYSQPLTRQIEEARKAPPLEERCSNREKTLSDAQARDLEELLAALKELESRFAQAPIAQPYDPRPAPSLQMRLPG